MLPIMSKVPPRRTHLQYRATKLSLERTKKTVEDTERIVEASRKLLQRPVYPYDPRTAPKSGK
jgi:hypothetical protein